MLAIISNGTNVRFSVYVQETIRPFVNDLSNGALNHVAIVFIHRDITQYEGICKTRDDPQRSKSFAGKEGKAGREKSLSKILDRHP